MSDVDSLAAIYRSRSDRLLAELWAVIGVLGALVGVVVSLLVSWWALPVALLAAVGCGFGGLAAGRRRLAATLSGGVVVGAQDVPRLWNITEGLCLLTGLEMPDLVVHDSPAANVAGFGSDAGAMTLVVTRGLLESLDRIELEAVVARTLSQMGDGRTAYLTTAVSTVGLPALLWPGLGGVVRSRLEREASTGDDFNADADGVRLTRYPPGLANALETMSRVGVDSGAAEVTRPLWLADPRDTGLPEYRGDLETRVAVLREL